MATAWPNPLRRILLPVLVGALTCAAGASAACSEDGADDVEPPRAHEKLTEAPAPRAAPVDDAPATEAPTTEATATEAPDDDAPATDAPATDAPATDAPATDAPATDDTPASRPLTGSAEAASENPSSYHLDDLDVEYEVPRRPARPRKGRPIEIVLRSSPAGAVAAVDGVPLGPTPSLWAGVADGSAREFTFVLPGYAIARYRFIPTQGGVVHGTLEPIKPEEAKPQSGRRPAAAASARPAPPPATR